MKKYRNPKNSTWQNITERPYVDNSDIAQRVKEIINSVRKNGDAAILRLTRSLDAADLTTTKVTNAEIENATIPTELQNAIQVAKSNIEKYHSSQLVAEQKVETTEGIVCWRENRAIENVGLYIPGGTAPLFSTILMLGIPATIAGCKNIILCTPPNKEGKINPAILWTANLLGITNIYKVGGAQAIAAMAIGTETIQKADKIFGPGNQYVTEAKAQIQTLGTAIDMPAGPSELLVIADESANPAFVAADLLSQAEHGADSQVILVSDSEKIIDDTITALNEQIEKLPRRDIAKAAIKNSSAILLDNIQECIILSNIYAPEHLIIASNKAEGYVRDIQNAGSIFLGNYSCESAGDYASGTNHTLPTNGYARSYSGVSVDSFIKKITIQNITPIGIQNIGPAIEIMAAAEGLDAHKNAVTIRLKSLANEN